MTMEEIAAALLEGFAGADANLDGLLSLNEARTVAGSLTRAQFDALDTNGDGGLSEAELRAALPASGGVGSCPIGAKRLDDLLGDLMLLALALTVLLGSRAASNHSGIR